MKLEIQSLMDGQHILSGAADGRRLLARLIALTPTANAPEALFLDFAGIQVATVSFLREGIVAYRDFVRASRQNAYPIVANASPVVIEELELFLNTRNDAMWSCAISDDETNEHRILGKLDPTQQKTFDLVAKLGTASAPELTSSFRDDKIGPTAWNNRLSSLVAKGLLVETRQGKTKTFRPLLEET